MTASTRVKATNIIFKVGSTTYSCDANMISLTLQDAPGAVRTFCEVQPTQEWQLQIDGIYSDDDASLYQVLLGNYGTEVTFQVSPTATVGGKKYTGTVVIDNLPPLEMTSGEFMNFSVTYTVKNTGLNPSSDLYYGVTVGANA